MKTYIFNPTELPKAKVNTIELIDELRKLDPDIALSINMGGEVKRNGVTTPLEACAEIMASDNISREDIAQVLKAHNPEFNDAEASIIQRSENKVSELLELLKDSRVAQAIRAKVNLV